MNEGPKKLVWPWVVAVLISLPVLYVASFGPACWLVSRASDSELPDAYRPIGWLMCNAPPAIERAFVAYAQAGIPSGSHVYVPDSSDSVIEIP